MGSGCPRCSLCFKIDGHHGAMADPHQGLTTGGTSKNQHRSSAAPKLLANDSGLFPFRFYAVHPKDVGDSKPQQFFEVPPKEVLQPIIVLASIRCWLRIVIFFKGD